MHPRERWPSFRAEHILFEDDDVLVVHKPAGVSSQAADPGRPDDLVTRLAMFLTERAGAIRTQYVGVHQRLDRETSGVMVFAKRPEANAGLAKQFEARTIEKRYLAVVVGWPEGARERSLVDVLRPAESGRVAVATPSHGRMMRSARGKGHAPHGQRAVTHVRALKRKGERALLELRLETGRMHQARVQLAHAGAPIAGCALYGRVPAPRLMLHAVSLAFAHPRTGKRISIRDNDTTALEAWLEHGELGEAIYDDESALTRALELACERRWGLGRAADLADAAHRTTAFRLVSDAGDALPGLAVDVYGGHLVAQFYAGEMWTDARRSRVLDALDALGFDGVYTKTRPKQANTLVDARTTDLAPTVPDRGTKAPDPLVVEEEGVPFVVRLGDGMSTGIFLDQRRNRVLVRQLARGKSVANLFAYTCAFSVAAAVGGANKTVSVDASAIALERGRENFARAGLSDALEKQHTFVAEDAFAWLARAAKKGERFDLVVVDPPSYSSTKKRRFMADKDYGELVCAAMGILGKRGQLVACCNHRGLSRAKFRRMVLEGVRAAGRELVQLKDLPDGPDFPAPFGGDAHMKSVLVTVA